MIALLAGFYADLGLRRITLHLNSLGDDTCRPAYRAELEAFRDAIWDGGPAPVPAIAGARALANALALRESAAQRRPMRPTLESSDPIPTP